MTTDEQPTIAQQGLTQSIDVLRRYFDDFGTEALSKAVALHRLSTQLRALGLNEDAERAINAMNVLVDTGQIKLTKDSIAFAKQFLGDLLAAGINKVIP